MATESTALVSRYTITLRTQWYKGTRYLASNLRQEKEVLQLSQIIDLRISTETPQNLIFACLFVGFNMKTGQ